MLTLTVQTLDDANLVLKALGKMPLEETVGLWSAFREQIFQQLPQPPAVPLPKTSRRRRNNGAHPPLDELTGNVAT